MIVPFLYRLLPALAFLAVFSCGTHCSAQEGCGDATRRPFCVSSVTGYLQGPDNDPMHAPSHLLPLNHGRTVVLDGANNRLAFFSADGSFETYVGTQGDAPGQFEHPLGLCKGPGDTVIAADTGNARLQILDPKGLFLRAVVIPSLMKPSRPTGVAWDPEGKRLFVTDRSNQV
ncbi:MAG: hypothetical protein ABIK28_10350, partial [Planctomycetota bacterium]